MTYFLYSLVLINVSNNNGAKRFQIFLRVFWKVKLKACWSCRLNPSQFAEPQIHIYFRKMRQTLKTHTNTCTHTHMDKCIHMYTQNPDYWDNLTFHSRAQGHKITGANIRFQSCSPLTCPFCVCLSGEWRYGRHCWTAVLITSSHAEITTVPANH